MAKLESGQTVYVKVKNCKLLNKPAVDAAVLAVLQPKTSVIWLAQATGTKEFHQVKYGNLIGFIFFTNLQREPVTNLPISNDLYKCTACNGLGYLKMNGMKESQIGNPYIHPVCSRCDGKGKEIPVKAYASDGTAVKA
jgi:hypothetical protein